jgi:CubicO group peptidase (beta-lactamase class C family)
MKHSVRSTCSLALMLALTVTSAADGPSPYSAADEALYLERFARLMDASRLGFGLESYEPLEPVPGARNPAPLARAAAGDTRIAAAALQAAEAYAVRNNSSAFMVWHDGKIEKASFPKGMKPEDTFPSRSLAKPMTAVAIGRALALGKIRSLDQPVADFISEWRGDPRRSKILVRHLLDMRSGFLPQGPAMTAGDILNRAYLHPRHEQIIIHDYPVVDEPGTRYEYNNATSELVAVLIERATGVRYGKWLSREVLQRIGAPGGTIWVNRPGGTAHSGCCLMLPAEAWLRLGVLLLQDGVWEGQRLLPPGYVPAMRTPTAENPYYGLGVYVAGRYIARRGFANPARDTEARRVLHSEPYLADDVFLFDGNSNQVVFIVPSRRLVVLRVGDNPPRGAGGEWDNSALPNLLIRGLSQGGTPQPR